MSEFEAYRGLFVAESRENHENLVKNLLLLELGSYQDAIDEIFRSIHTLKGASASMGFVNMEHLCHSMEDVFQLIRSGSAEISPDLVNLLLGCSDLIEQMLDDIEAGGDSSSKNPTEQVQTLKKWIEQRGGTQKAQADVPLVPAEVQTSDEHGEDTTAGEPVEYQIQITISSDCQMKDVRALLALGNLKSVGTIISMSPTLEAIDEGKFDGRLELIVASDSGEEALKTAASGTDISEIVIHPVRKPEVTTHDLPETSKMEEEKKEEAEKKQSQTPDKSREIKNLRVDIHQLDHIMNLVEDLVINRGRLKQIAEHHKIKEMDEAIGMVDRSVSELQSLMMNIRMIPLNHIFNRLPRVVRDVAQYDNKEVDFVIEGGETELDRSVMDGLNDPLLHLIRNAVNHGIESPELREKAKKPKKGFVKLTAHRDRDNVIIELIDDGAGINVDKVKAKGIEKGLITPDVAETFTTEQAIDLLFQPGFSTADKISDISGRGVGLDVVKRSIESLKGTIRVETTLGKGSRFELLLPPTMAIVDVMIVRINDKRFGIPISSIVEVANFKKEETHQIGKGEAILLRDEVLQILWLNEMVGESKACEILIVVQYQKRKCCIPVDIVEGKQEVVVKPLSGFIGNTRGVSGVTILGDGGVVPVIDVNTIVQEQEMKLSTVQADAIQELGNIGAAHAATTLSQMLGSTIEMSVPAIKVIDLSQLGNYMGEESAAMVAFELQGEIPHGGYVVFYITRESAIRMTNTMLGMTETDRPMSEMDESALIEVGNIMVSAFLDATAELLGFVMLPSPPALSIDMAHAAMQSLIAQMQEETNEVLLFSTELTCEEYKIDSDIIMMPERSTLERIITLLENMMKTS